VRFIVFKHTVNKGSWAAQSFFKEGTNVNANHDSQWQPRESKWRSVHVRDSGGDKDSVLLIHGWPDDGSGGIVQQH